MNRVRMVLLCALVLTQANAQPHPSTDAVLQDLAHPALRFVDDLPAYSPHGQVEGIVRLWGHGSHRRNFMGNLIRRWIAEFARHQPAVSFENRMYGTASAIGALYTGAGDIALLGEEISPAAARAFQRSKGYAPTEIQVATGSVDVNFFDYAHMIFVHRDNPIAGLNLAQLEAIFGMDGRRGLGRIRSWDELGLAGEWAGRPIQPYGWKVDEDFALFFRERVLEHSHRWNPLIREHVHLPRPDGKQYDHGQQIVDALAGDRFGIAISNVRYGRPEVRPLPLAWQPGGPFVSPTRENLISQEYPLVRIIPAFIDVPPDGGPEPAVAEFLRYVLSREGQLALIEETGYLPLGQKIISAQLAKLDGEKTLARTTSSIDTQERAPPDHSLSLPPVVRSPTVSGVIRISGSEAFASLVALWQADYRALSKGVRIVFAPSGSDVAMAALYTGGADVALLGRDATEPEVKAFEWIHRYKPGRVEIATGGDRAGCSPALAFFVHPENPLASLTLDQADALFGEELRRGAAAVIRKWGELGLTGEWADEPVRLYSPQVESGTGRFFREIVLGGSRKLPWDSLTEFSESVPHRNPTHDASAKVLAALEGDRLGLAVAGIDAAEGRALKLLAVVTGGEVAARFPSRQEVASRDYPLARPVAAYFHRTPGTTVDPVLAEFIRYILGAQGQAAVASAGGFLPLPKTMAEELRVTFQ